MAGPSEPWQAGVLAEDAALLTILEGTATETGARFLTALVESLARALRMHAALVTEYLPESGRARALAFRAGDDWIEDFEYEVAGTPCQVVLEGARFVHHPENVQACYPDDDDLKQLGAVSYMGVPLSDPDGTVLGHLAVMDRRPMPEEPRGLALFRIFAARATAELRRVRAEAEIWAREAKLGRLVDSAMDAIIELDRDLRVSLLNPAAEKVFRCSAGEVVGRNFSRLLSDDACARLAGLIRELDARPEGQRYTWIPGGLEARHADGGSFPAEATLSRFEIRREPFYTLILRDVNERLEAERKIRSLTVETQVLREEIEALRGFDEILGRSEALRRALRDVEQVAQTDATALVLGETGTGKEVIARAIHAKSPRRDAPLVVVNCATIPANLIESELFGHERGAFTGATQKRDGRFSLADGGTIFLDEIGELPLDLQAKLLRVLQEGEFEPVGSSRTRKVDVRVIAATNRDLQRATESGAFREDLYYRLNVFPIEVPPLRERGDDVVELAAAFSERFARRMARRIRPLSQDCVRRLRGYAWPGNVRELQNVIERAVITSRDGELDLGRCLPDAPEAAVSSEPAANAERILSAREFQELERANLLRALEACGWRVSGDKGAARRLGMHPSTLSSRLKALGIQRPR